MISSRNTPGGDAASGSHDPHAQKTSENLAAIEAEIRNGARALYGPAPALVCDLLEYLKKQGNSRQRLIVERVERLQQKLKLREQEVCGKPTQVQGLFRVLDGGSSASGGTPNIEARTIPARIVQMRRDAGPAVPDAITLVLHVAFAGTVTVIEILLFEAGLDVAFTEVVGAPTQAVSNGMLSFVCLTVIIGGVSAFKDASERTKKWMRKINRFAVGCFLTGSVLFVGNAVFRTLSDAAAADSFDVTDTSTIGAVGYIGLSLVFGSGGFIAWMTSHHSLLRVKDLFGKGSHALGLKRRAALMERDWLDDNAQLAAAKHDLEEVREELEHVEQAAVNRASALCVPALTAAQGLLTQLDLYGQGSPNIVPDPLMEEALSYDREMLREKVERFASESEPAAILAKLHPTRPTRKRSAK